MLQFKVGFDMESEFEDTATRRIYRVRVGAHVQNTRSDYLNEVISTIGTVRCRYPHFHEYPPREIVEELRTHFGGISLVGMRYTSDYTVEYNGKSPPRPLLVWGGNTWIDPRWDRRCTQERNEEAA